MKNKILELRNQGKSYKEIKEELNCSKSTISYYCGEGQKEKTRDRTKKYRKIQLNSKIEVFKNKSNRDKLRDFQRRDGFYLKSKQEINFTREDVIKKIGKNPICYLTGKPINLSNSRSYHFDHIIPPGKGGDNSLQNLGLLRKEINLMKHNFTIDELITYCKEILEYQGYKVLKGE
jgi:hypothetical protein